MFNDQVAERTMRALKSEDPEAARAALERIVADHPDRLDVQHALAVTELRLGHAGPALQRLQAIEEQARARGDEASLAVMGQVVLARAAACEDLYAPDRAEDAYRTVMAHEEGNPRAVQGLAYLLFSWGRGEEGAAVLKEYIDGGHDEQAAIEGNRHFLTAWTRLHEDDVHPRMFLEAHRGSYVEFFDHHALRMADQGWIAEAARMRRDEAGNVVNVIPDGARPYAAVRVDLVDPRSGQPGMIGDQPMVVALAGFEPLARAAALTRWPERDHPFPVWVSTQCPWDQLSVQVKLSAPSREAVEALDAVIGDWYSAGFEGAFGTADRGRFHYISDPELQTHDVLSYDVDCGRAELTAVTDLLKRLSVLHDRVGIGGVLLGRGYVPD